MFDYTDQSNSSPKGALEIEMRARKQSQKQAMLTAAYKKDAQAGARRSNRGLKGLLTSLLSFF